MKKAANNITVYDYGPAQMVKYLFYASVTLLYSLFAFLSSFILCVQRPEMLLEYLWTPVCFKRVQAGFWSLEK